MAYRIEFTKSAEKELTRLPKADRRRVANKIDSLSQNPRPRNAKRLLAAEGLYRVRYGDYRIVYQIQGRVLTVVVVRIRHRKDVYRNL